MAERDTMKIATRKEGRIFLPGTNPFRYQVPCPTNHASLLTLEVTVQIPKELVPTKCLCQQTAINVQTQRWLLFITQHIFIRMCLKKSTALASAWQRRMRKQEMKVGWQQPPSFYIITMETTWTKPPKQESTTDPLVSPSPIWWQARDIRRILLAMAEALVKLMMVGATEMVEWVRTFVLAEERSTQQHPHVSYKHP